MLKILLNQVSSDITILFRDELAKFVLLVLASPDTPTEGFNTSGIVYGRLLCFQNSEKIVDSAIDTVQTLDTSHANLSDLARLSLVQGIAATLDLDTLTSSRNYSYERTTKMTSPLESCWRYSLLASQVATDPMVRWGALRGLSTLASRWKQHQQHDGDNKTPDNCHDGLIQETLEVVLQAWENPPLRKLGTAIPGLFRTIVKLLHEKQLEDLCRHVVGQPVNRKGRYVALEILLPFMPEYQKIEPESLLDGIGDSGPNTGPIADLWTKLLETSWTEIIKTHDAASIDSFNEWKKLWVPSLSNHLVAPALSRRRQVANFCLPRVVDLMKRVESLRPYLSGAMIAILENTGAMRGQVNQITIGTTESLDDRALWAQLEVRTL